MLTWCMGFATDACDICAWLGCLRSGLEEHKKSQHVECMLQVMYLFRNKFDGSNFSIHPHFTKMIKAPYMGSHQQSASLWRGTLHTTLPKKIMLYWGGLWDTQSYLVMLRYNLGGSASPATLFIEWMVRA